MDTMITLSNDRFLVEFATSTASLAITDRQSRKKWRLDRPFVVTYGKSYTYDLATHCRMDARSDGERLDITFDRFDFWAQFEGNGYCKPDPGPRLVFKFAVILKEDHLVFTIGEVGGMDDEELDVRFPNGIGRFNGSLDASLLLPCGFGSLMQFPRTDHVRLKCSFGFNYNSLPTLAIFEPDGGLGYYLKTPFDVLMEVTADPQIGAEVSTTFTFEKHNANYPRELRVYTMKPNQNYVDWAKRYRSIVQAEGRFMSLADKIKRSPEVEKLVGAIIWKHRVYPGNRPDGVKKGYSLYMSGPSFNSHEGLPNNWTAKEVFDTAKARGFDRVCVYSTGWNFMGYDSGYPQRLPPNPNLGSSDEFKSAAEYARSLSEGYIFSIHDNYSDAYRNSPQFDQDVLMTDKDGVPVRGGIWRGGRAWLICPLKSLEYAKRDLPAIADIFGRGSIYVDVMGSFKTGSCHHPEHALGASGEMEARRNLLTYAKEVMGSVASEGAPHDYCADVVDLGAFCGLYTLEHETPLDPMPVPVPFWQLVYHDSVLNYTAEGAYRAHGSEYLLYVALFNLLPTQFNDDAAKMSHQCRRLYIQEMVSHEFLEPATVTLAPDGSLRTTGVARTVFADGTAIVANFTDRPFSYLHWTIAPRSYEVINGLEDSR